MRPMKFQRYCINAFVSMAFVGMLSMVPADLLAAGPESAPSLAGQSSPAVAKLLEGESIYKSKPRKLDSYISRWMKEDKASAFPLVLSAYVNFQEKHFKKCVSLCDKAIDKQPDCADAYYWKGRALEAMKKPLEAASEYRTAMAAQKDFSDAKQAFERISAELGSPL